jgi:hypothetical protein
MNALPDALRPWREWLSWFDPELVTQLGPLLQRLHPLLGPFRGQSHGGEPELEGLDDLRTRGSYEHLLASEWLLADELPDEFLRRAASGEHMFLAPRPRAKRADRSIIALFDSGPLQLGAPRLAQLAMWILLARRALQAQGDFRWGSLQAPGKLLDARTVDDLKTLLGQRSFAVPDAAGLANWRAALDEQQVGGECWLIGPPRIQYDLSETPSFTHRVSFQNDLHGAALDVLLLERGNERSVSLPLPEPSLTSPLLRGSFARSTGPAEHTSEPRAVALQRPPVIACDGSRVGVALRDEAAALVYVVPRSIQNQPARPRFHHWSAGYGALAISFIGKRMGVLMSDANELRFWGTPPLVMTPCPTQEEFHAPTSVAGWLSLAWMHQGPEHCVYVVDQSNRLLRWKVGGPLQLVRANVLGMVQLHNALMAYASYNNGSIWFARLTPTSEPHPHRFLGNGPPDAAVLFGRGSTVAIRLSKGETERWQVGSWSSLHARWETQLPGGSRAIGLMRERNGRTGLVTLDRTILRLHFVDGGNELLYEAPDPIVSCSMCPNSAVIAMMTERRQLIVMAAVTRELRLIVQTGRQSHASN